MPNLNPNPSDQIDISGNTFTLGATLPGTPTVGNVTTNITGLNPGTSYYFAVVSFSDISGYSGWAGPIVVYIQPEIRTAINAYSWAWPHGPQYGIFDDVDYTIPQRLYSNTASNLIYLSNQNHITDVMTIISGAPGPDLFKTTAISGPCAGINVFAVVPKAFSYNSFSKKIYNLQPGTTYTYSFYFDLSGATSFYLQYRIDHPAGMTTPIRQILPVDQGNFDLNESSSTSSARYVTYPASGTTGWCRFVAQFVTNLGQTQSSFSIFSGDYLVGATSYFAGPQVAIGTAAGPFVETNIIADWEGVCGDDDKLVAFGNSYGLTYIAPCLVPSIELLQNIQNPARNSWIFAEGFAKSNTIARNAKILKQLPENKRALLPSWFFTPNIWYWDDSSMNFANPAGTTYKFAQNYYETTSTNQRYPTVWLENGISFAKPLWNSILQEFSGTGATFDYVISNAEMYSGFDSFLWIPGITTAMSSTSDKASFYNQSYLGLTSWADWVNDEGISINNVMNPAHVFQGAATGKYDYMVWNGINYAHILRAMDAIFEDTNTFYPKATLAEYQWSTVFEGPAVNGPPDFNGHPQYYKYNFGNAAGPQLYNIVGGIAQAWGICGANPTYLYFAPDPLDLKPGDTRPPFNAWTSLVSSLQNVRNTKRAKPNLPITPWICSIKYTGNNPGTTAERPGVPVADVNVGYNPQQGVTYTIAGGNSAYYYEVIRHLMLSGTKGLLWWNNDSFLDQRVTGNYFIKFASGQGATGFIEDMQRLNEVIGEVNDKIKGFTLTTADSSRISWLAPYVASGAPGPNGITWYWRITTNPGNTTFVNGQTLSVANNNTVGTWVTTSGPTLSGITITYT